MGVFRRIDLRGSPREYNQGGHTDTNGGIRNVKGGIQLPGKIEFHENEMDLDKIRNGPQAEPVDQIPDGPARNASVRHGLQF
jgi:hypothetical protein